MQSYRDNDLLNTMVAKNTEELFEALRRTEMKEAKLNAATHHIIGRIPEAGEKVVIHGLSFTVKKFYPKTNILHLILD